MLDVEVVINVYVVGRAVATAGTASERKSGHQIVVNASDRDGLSRGSRGSCLHRDQLPELADDFVVAAKRLPPYVQRLRTNHVDADL